MDHIFETHMSGGHIGLPLDSACTHCLVDPALFVEGDPEEHAAFNRQALRLRFDLALFERGASI